MKTDLGEQIHEFMEHGLHPVSMADIKTRAPVRVGTLRRVMARSKPGSGRLILAGAAGIAAGVALVMAILLPGSGTGHSTSPARLAAWTVVKQPDGSVKVTLHEIRDPARLQHILRADGIPAKIHTGSSLSGAGMKIPDCHVYPLGGPDGTPFSVWRKVFYGPHTKVSSYTFWVYPSAIPRGKGVAIFIDYGPAKLSNHNQSPGEDLGYGVNGYGLYLAKASPRCTGT